VKAAIRLILDQRSGDRNTESAIAFLT